VFLPLPHVDGRCADEVENAARRRHCADLAVLGDHLVASRVVPIGRWQGRVALQRPVSQLQALPCQTQPPAARAQIPVLCTVYSTLADPRGEGGNPVMIPSSMSMGLATTAAGTSRKKDLNLLSPDVFSGVKMVKNVGGREALPRGSLEKTQSNSAP